mmetsp:Transcript_115560/g.204259  ORF Transcript_115560/g.204259 Transcript_115560/m.204259 type:complete len:120 (-) Transcript_115560:252-611(-)
MSSLPMCTPFLMMTSLHLQAHQAVVVADTSADVSSSSSRMARSPNRARLAVMARAHVRAHPDASADPSGLAVLSVADLADVSSSSSQAALAGTESSQAQAGLAAMSVAAFADTSYVSIH